ncbi:hypothetical protein CURE108131_20850 [Cupriavidus respiraculi]|uniref:Transmembrane protein n=1 Tax=Cupriavidus respiraculi TaxID=195930 RepID=A0ABM8X059_9BURK|nr:hypothetical protein [Cupriavidus respiraculi]CAG9173204.1 hypothetical protein LMG21510_02184 [Cupriavidus respiraculi]
MTYDPASNTLLAVAKCSRGRQWAAMAATGIAVGVFWYLAVALRVGT